MSGVVYEKINQTLSTLTKVVAIEAIGIKRNAGTADCPVESVVFGIAIVAGRMSVVKGRTDSTLSNRLVTEFTVRSGIGKVAGDTNSAIDAVTVVELITVIAVGDCLAAEDAR